MKARLRGRLWNLVVFLGLCFALSACGIREQYVRDKQVRTFAGLRSISSKLSSSIAEHGGAIKEVEAQKIISGDENRGVDAWGNPIIFHSTTGNGRFSYVLISRGSDGEFDLKNLDDYFSMPSSMIHGDGARDIVFRDGEPVTMAGK